MLKIKLLSFLLILLVSQTFAQKSAKVIVVSPQVGEVTDSSLASPIWFNVGLGGGTPGIAYGGDINFRLTKRLISQVSVVHGETLTLWSNIPEESVTSLGFLVGVRSKGDYEMAAILGGAGAVFGFHRGEFLYSSGGWFSPGIYEKNSFASVGLLGNVQFFLKPFSSFGLGLDIFVCLNPETLFGVALLSLQFGG